MEVDTLISPAQDQKTRSIGAERDLGDCAAGGPGRRQGRQAVSNSVIFLCAMVYSSEPLQAKSRELNFSSFWGGNRLDLGLRMPFFTGPGIPLTGKIPINRENYEISPLPCPTAERRQGRRAGVLRPSTVLEIWEGDERRKFQALESGDSLNGRNLFTELPFL